MLREKIRREREKQRKRISPDTWIERAKERELLPEYEIEELCQMAIEILMMEGNIQPVAAPVTICGNIHGHFNNLLEIFKIAGEPPETNFLFLGSYIDRGHYSLETITLLLALKIRYPDKITLLRGNHESRQITQVYGFYDECVRKYPHKGGRVWQTFCEVFDCLPLAALVEGSVFCVQGGLSPKLYALEQLQTINRFQEIPPEGVITDLLWADPEGDVEGWHTTGNSVSWNFGAQPVDEFCHANSIKLIVRGHQLQQDGYKFHFPNQNLVSLWSASNYCGRTNNSAAILHLDSDMQQTFKTFAGIEEPVPENYPPPMPYFI